MRERGGGARRLHQFKSLGRLEPSLSHFLLLSFFLGFFFPSDFFLWNARLQHFTADKEPRSKVVSALLRSSQPLRD